MGIAPTAYLLGIAGYAIVLAVVSVLAYLVIRFGVRDGLRAHARWLDQRTPPRD